MQAVGIVMPLLVVPLLAVAACGTTGTAATPRVTARVPGAAAARASAWSSAFGDAAHTSPAAGRGPQTATVRWTRHLEGAVTPGPAVGADGSVLAASNGGVLHALDPATGRDRWTYDGGGSYGNDLSTTPAVLGDGTILWPAPGERLVALSSAGRLLWSMHLSGFVLSPALGSGGRVYVEDMAGHLSAVDTGPAGAHHLAWAVSTGSPSYGSPAVAADGTVYTTGGKQLAAVEDDGTSGRVRWTFTAKDDVEVSPAVAPDGTVVLGTNNDVEYGITPAGKVRWTFAKGDYSYSSPVVTGGRAYFGDHLGDLDVVDAATGAVVHRDTTIPRSSGTSSNGVGIWTAPLVDAAGDAYVATAAGHVYGFGPAGNRLWDLDTGGVDSSYPALTSGGLLVLGSSTGMLYAVG